MILLYDLVGADEARPFSPHCWKAKMALAHKGLPFKTEPVRFLDVAGVEGLKTTVPVIRDGDTVVADSFKIALYLDQAYPDRPTLFGGPGGEAMARFIERYSQTLLHPFLNVAAIMDIHDAQDEPNRTYLRKTREVYFGKPLEAVGDDRDALEPEFRKRLGALRSMLDYQPFIGGQSPLFPDYIVFGALQWMRIVSTFRFIDDPVIEAWFERCLDLHGGLGREVPPAA